MPTPTYPANHQLGMRVPKGGSDCAKCEYLNADGKTCRNTYFVKWNGSGKLPAPADSYCCDLYETKEGDKARSPHGFPSLQTVRRQTGASDSESGKRA